MTSTSWLRSIARGGRATRVSSRLSASLVLSAVLVMASGKSGEASIMVALDLPDLVKQAEHIAVVEVVAVRPAWDERHERIYSTIELKVVENWKPPVVAKPATGANPAAAAAAPTTPATPDHLTIVQAGGTVGDVSMTVFGQGNFVAGERSLVFLRGPATRAQVVGMTQGKRALRYEATSRRWLVAPPDLRQTKLVPPPSSLSPSPSRRPPHTLPPRLPPATSAQPTLASEASPPHPAPAREMPLDELRVEVRRLLGTSQP